MAPLCDICTPVRHFLMKCSRFLALSTDEKVKHLTAHDRCLNCFGTGHKSSVHGEEDVQDL